MEGGTKARYYKEAFLNSGMSCLVFTNDTTIWFLSATFDFVYGWSDNFIILYEHLVHN
jgi:hypothetical protein